MAPVLIGWNLVSVIRYPTYSLKKCITELGVAVKVKYSKFCLIHLYEAHTLQSFKCFSVYLTLHSGVFMYLKGCSVASLSSRRSWWILISFKLHFSWRRTKLFYFVTQLRKRNTSSDESKSKTKTTTIEDIFFNICWA